MANRKIGVIVGSLRKGSYNRQIATKLMSLFPSEYQVEMIEIGNLPLYNEDLDTPGNVPQAWTDFREKVAEKEGFLFVTPEYNRSMPAAMKNALDVASRPFGENAWGGKPAAVVSGSIGATGGFGAHHHLRQTLVVLGVTAAPQPEVYLGNVTSFINEDGTITKEDTVAFFQGIVDGFVLFTEQFYK